MHNFAHAAISGECRNYKVENGIFGKHKENKVINFELFHCIKKTGMKLGLSAGDVYPSQFISRFHNKYGEATCPHLGRLWGFLNNAHEHMNFHLYGDNFYLERGCGYWTWEGICEFYLFWDENDIYLSIARIPYGVTYDRETVDKIFEKIRALIQPL